MKRDEIQAQIELLECLKDTLKAIEDVEGVEWEPGEANELNVDVKAHVSSVTFLHSIPADIFVAGLRAMAHDLRAQAKALQGETS